MAVFHLRFKHDSFRHLYVTLDTKYLLSSTAISLAGCTLRHYNEGIVVVIPLIAFIFWIGIYPNPVLKQVIFAQKEIFKEERL